MAHAPGTTELSAGLIAGLAGFIGRGCRCAIGRSLCLDTKGEARGIDCHDSANLIAHKLHFLLLFALR